MTGVSLVPARQPAPLRIFLNPYLQVFLGALLDTSGELLLRKGSLVAPKLGGAAGVFGITSLISGWTWIGIISYCLSLVSWLYVLRSVPLSIAFPLINIVHALVPLGAWIFLGEHVSHRRWLGITLIIMGVLMIVRPLIKAEQNL